MDKLDGKSMNIVNDNIEKLKKIFPEILSENKIDFKKLEEELGNFTNTTNERYKFTWNGKQEAKKAQLKRELQGETMRVVFKDSSFKDLVIKTNTIAILKQFGMIRCSEIK
jgi:adenine-specific DNA-methyltransferase